MSTRDSFTVTLSNISASNLMNRDKFSISDPFVRFSVGDEVVETAT